MKTIRPLTLIGALAAVAIACGGVTTGESDGGGGSGGTAGIGTGGAAGVGRGGTAGFGGGGTAGIGPGGGAGRGGGGTKGEGGGGTKGEGGSRGSGGGGTKGSGPVDAATDVALPPLDAALASLDAAPPGLAGFAFIVNDVVQHPMGCATTEAHWEFPPYPGTSSMACGPCMVGGACPGVKSVVLANTGATDLAYIAGPCWDFGGISYLPGYTLLGSEYKAGVLAPGAYVNITSFYNTGAVAVVGSAEPFSYADSSYARDEGTIPWPPGVAGSGGATTMYVAEIQIVSSCAPVGTALW